MALDLAPGLYAIFDGETLSGIEQKAAQLADLKLCAVQLRAKSLSPLERTTAAQALLKTFKPKKIPVIINDDLALAQALGCTVHLGQEDLAAFPGALSRLTIPFGISTHTLPQALNAQALGAAYVGFGPVYATTSKINALAARGIQEVRTVVEALRIPVVAIGGITPERVNELAAVGVKMTAMISGLNAPRAHLEAAILRLTET